MIRNQRFLLYRAIQFLVISGGSYVIEGCHSSSKELNICLNIFLERDLPLVETILKGQKKDGRFGGGRVLLDDIDVKVICQHTVELYDCYKDVVKECDTYRELYEFMHLMSLFRQIYSHLCEITTNNVRDLLLSTKCLTVAENHITNCSNHGFSWTFTWKEVLRMQVTPVMKCAAIDQYRTCLMDGLQNVACGEEAASKYGSLLNLWYQHWCVNFEPRYVYYISAGSYNKYMIMGIFMSVFFSTNSAFFNNI